jgi:hypothetical protein
MDSLWVTLAMIHTNPSDYFFMPHIRTNGEVPDQVSQIDITCLVLWGYIC